MGTLLHATTNGASPTLDRATAEVPFAGWAADPAESSTLSQLMYAALAERRVADGLVAHYITIPAHPKTAESWLDLGFGRYVATAVTDTASVAGTARARGLAALSMGYPATTSPLTYRRTLSA